MSDLEAKIADAGDKLVVIDFFATWCGPCKMIAPRLEEWEAQMSNVKFLKVDVDEAEDVAAHYQISAMPTFILIKNKQKVLKVYPLKTTSESVIDTSELKRDIRIH